MRNFSIQFSLLLISISSLLAQPASSPRLTATAFYERGAGLHDADELNHAIDFYSEALRIDPQHTKALYNRGLAYYVQGKYNKALFDFDKVLELLPDDQQAQEHRARLRFLLHDNDGALSDYTMIVSNNPDCIQHVNRGIVHLEKRQFAEALEDFEAALTFDPNDQEAWNGKGDVYFALGKYEKSLTFYERALLLNPHDARTLNNRANAYQELGMQKDALESYDLALQTEANPDILVNRGFYALAQGNLPQALADCEEASRLDYRNDRAYYGIGIACVQLAKYDRALENLNKAIEIENGEADYFFQRGQAAFYLSLISDAQADFVRAIELGADADEVNPFLQQCQTTETGQTGQERGASSFTEDDESFGMTGLFEEGTAKAPKQTFIPKGYDNTSNHFLGESPENSAAPQKESQQIKYAEQLFAGGRYEKSIAIYNQILRSNPEQAMAYYGRALAYTELGQHQAAIRDYTRSIGFHAQFTEAFYYRANAFLASEMYREAIADYQVVEQLNPGFSKLYFMRAQALTKTQETEKAIADYDKYLETNPKDITAINNLAGLKWRTGNIFGAMQTYNRGIGIDAASPQLRTNRGRLYYQQGNLSLALHDFNTAINLGADLPMVYYYRGVVNYEMGAYEAAAQDFTQGLRGDPENEAIFYYRRALAYHHQGRLDKATADYDQVLKIHPQHEEAIYNRRLAIQRMSQKGRPISTPKRDNSQVSVAW